MREAAPINRRGVLLGACAVAATVALPQVSSAVVIANPMVDIPVVPLAGWDIATGGELDFWAMMFRLQRGTTMIAMSVDWKRERYSPMFQLESDEALRARIQARFQEDIKALAAEEGFVL